MLFAVFAFFILPYDAQSARFLDEEEKNLAFYRMQVDSSSVVGEKFVLKDALKIFKHPTSWMILGSCPRGVSTLHTDLLNRDRNLSWCSATVSITLPACHYQTPWLLNSQDQPLYSGAERGWGCHAPHPGFRVRSNQGSVSVCGSRLCIHDDRIRYLLYYRNRPCQRCVFRVLYDDLGNFCTECDLGRLVQQQHRQ